MGPCRDIKANVASHLKRLERSVDNQGNTYHSSIPTCDLSRGVLREVEPPHSCSIEWARCRWAVQLPVADSVHYFSYQQGAIVNNEKAHIECKKNQYRFQEVEFAMGLLMFDGLVKQLKSLAVMLICLSGPTSSESLQMLATQC